MLLLKTDTMKRCSFLIEHKTDKITFGNYIARYTQIKK
jgi:hypothetical protein